MTNTELQAWKLIGQLTPVQQYHFALKILQSVEPKDLDEVSAEQIEDTVHNKLWNGKAEIVQLVLTRKADIEGGKVKPISLEKFKNDLQQRIDEHRS